MKELVVNAFQKRRNPHSAPFRVDLTGGPSYDLMGSNSEQPHMMLNETTCESWGIPISTDIVGRTLILTIEIHKIIAGPRVSRGDNVEIKYIEERRRVTPFGFGPQGNAHQIVDFVLFLKTKEEGGHLCESPCPCYVLPIRISNREYESVKMGISRSARISFSLKPQ